MQVLVKKDGSLDAEENRIGGAIRDNGGRAQQVVGATCWTLELGPPDCR